MKLITCSKQYRDLPFAHRQPHHGGHCARIHGHNWGFEIEFYALERDDCGFVMDFGKLKPLKDWLDATFDHALVLNDGDPMTTDPAFMALYASYPSKLTLVPDCSCEGLAAYVFTGAEDIVNKLTGGRVTVRRVVCWEDSKNSATCEVAR